MWVVLTTVVCVSLSPIIFIFLTLSVICVIQCASLENYLVRVSVPSSAVLPSSWVCLAGQSASVDRFSSLPMILFSSGIPLILLLGFASLKVPPFFICVRLYFYFILFGKDTGFVAGVIMVDKAERSIWMEWALHIGQLTGVDFISIAYTHLLLQSHSHCSYHTEQSHKWILF
jgi:hypothetical protein